MNGGIMLEVFIVGFAGLAVPTLGAWFMLEMVNLDSKEIGQ